MDGIPDDVPDQRVKNLANVGRKGLAFSSKESVNVAERGLASRGEPGSPVAIERSGLAAVTGANHCVPSKPKGSKMIRKLSDAQLLALTAATQREDRCLAPPPRLKGVALKALALKLIADGLAREVRAKETAAIWRTDAATDRTYALKLTPKGEVAVAKSDGEADTSAKSRAKRLDNARALRAGKRPIESSLAAPGAGAQGDDGYSSNDRSEPRANSKLALLVDLLSSDRGATIEELAAATNWLQHTTRAALTRLRQRGFGFERFRGARGRASTYRLDTDRRSGQGTAR